MVENIEDLVIAKMDHVANVVRGLEITSYPTIVFFSKDFK